ncbi:hypothetical protein B0T24DRAFT_110395 [Lasiosphaeria ovina]|uniref:Uncharacterized protein n=1 Tax=Lasiosphaeria ovina TaxID=92902 RepID=A0AAE0JTD7_9PEZI|nr:hypothetical protein B0T24DRAFT_110395 [Lasiosphaeria ovina]
MLIPSPPTLGRALALVWAVAAGFLPGTTTASAIPVSNNTDGSLTARAAAAPPWTAQHGLTSAGYQSTYDTLVRGGYHLTFASGYTYNNDPRFAAIWEKSATAAWATHHGMTSAQYQSLFNTYTAQGYRPRLVNGYTVSNSARFIAIWDKSPTPGWIARHGLSSAQYQAAFDSFVGQGYRLAHVSGYAEGGQARYAALWEKNTAGAAPWFARHGMTSAQYQASVDSLVAQGYRPTLVSGYVVGNVDYYAAIWEKSAVAGWIARHGLTSAQYQAEFDKWSGQGYRLTVVSAYTLNSNRDRYAAIWVKK